MRESAGTGGRWRRIAGLVFVLAAFFFLGSLIGDNLADLRAHRWSVRPGLLVLSLVVHVAGLAWGVRVWQLLLRRMEIEVGYIPLARIWFVSGLGRYIPGKVWQFVGAAHLGSSVGLGPAITVTSLAAHTGFFLVGALLVAVFLVPLGAVQVGLRLDLLRWLAPLLLLLLHPAVIAAVLGRFRKITGREVATWRGSWGDGITLVLFSVIGWVITGGALHLFLLSLTPISLAAAPAVIGINALAFVVGYLFFIAPAGLGAKEGALAVMLSLFVAAPVAALLAIAARLWSVAAEVIPALLLLRIRSGAPPAVDLSGGVSAER